MMGKKERKETGTGPWTVKKRRRESARLVGAAAKVSAMTRIELPVSGTVKQGRGGKEEGRREAQAGHGTRTVMPHASGSNGQDVPSGNGIKLKTYGKILR